VDGLLCSDWIMLIFFAGAPPRKKKAYRCAPPLAVRCGRGFRGPFGKAEINKLIF